MSQIKSFGIGQTAKTIALLYLIGSAVIMVPSALIMLISSGEISSLLFILLPIPYGIICYISVAIGCWLYNKVAAKFGGIEIEIS